MERDRKIHIPRTRPLTGFEILKGYGLTNKDLEAVKRVLHDTFPKKFPEILKFPGRKHRATDEEIKRFLGV